MKCYARKGNRSNRKLIACGYNVTAMVDMYPICMRIHIKEYFSRDVNFFFFFFFIANIKKPCTVFSNWPIIGAIDEKIVCQICINYLIIIVCVCVCVCMLCVLCVTTSYINVNRTHGEYADRTLFLSFSFILFLSVTTNKEDRDK